MSDNEQKIQAQPEMKNQQESADDSSQAAIPTNENNSSLPTNNQKYKLSKRHWICLIGGVGLIFQAAIIIIILITVFGGGNYTVNSASEDTDLSVSEGYRLYISESENLAFLYPAECSTSHDEANGTYIYLAQSGEEPYILVLYSSGKSTSPEKYFSQYSKLLRSTYENAKVSKIAEVEVDGKTLYMVRSTVSEEGSTFTVDRYIELYEGGYVQYTVKSYHINDDELVLCSIISSLRLNAAAYHDAQAEAESTYNDTVMAKNESIGISMSIPTALNVQEIPVGILAQNNELMLFASYHNTDATGAAIYNMNDFVSRCSAISGLLPAQLGIDEVNVSNGRTATLGGQDAYLFDMQLVSGGFTGSGQLYMLSGSNTGCYLVYYAVADNVAAAETLQTVGQLCATSFSATDAPQNVRKFDIYTYQKTDFSVLCERGIVSNGMLDTGAGIALYISSDEQAPPLTVEGYSTEMLGVSSPEDFITALAVAIQDENPDIAYTLGAVTPISGGRFEAVTADITYSYNDINWTICLTAFADQNGRMWSVRFTTKPENLEVFKRVRDDIVWSFKLN